MLWHCIGFVATLVLVLEQWNFNAILLTDNLICEMKPFYHLASVNGPAGAILLPLCPATATSIVLVLLMTNMHHPRGSFCRLFWELHSKRWRWVPLCHLSLHSLSSSEFPLKVKLLVGQISSFRFYHRPSRLLYPPFIVLYPLGISWGFAACKQAPRAIVCRCFTKEFVSPSWRLVFP